MGSGNDAYHLCLQHQMPEDQMTPLGLVCPRCKQKLYVDPPRGPGHGFWESQPAAYTLDRAPCFVYRLTWHDFQIRSLHAAASETDDRGQKLRAAAEGVLAGWGAFLGRPASIEETPPEENWGVDWQPGDDGDPPE